MVQKPKGAGSRKYDRNRAWCKAYDVSGTRDVNKARRIARHLRRFPWDEQAADRLAAISAGYRKRAGVTLPERPLPLSPTAQRAKQGVTLTALRKDQREAA